LARQLPPGANSRARLSQAILEADLASEDGGSPPISMHGMLSGRLGELPFDARAKLVRGCLRATLELPRITPAGLSSVLPGLELQRTLRGRLLANGRLPDIDFQGNLD